MRRSKKNAVGEVHETSPVDELSFTQEEMLDEVSWAEETMNVDDTISSVPSSAVEIGKAGAPPFRTMFRLKGNASCTQTQVPVSSSNCAKSTKKRKKDAPKSLNGLLSLIAEQKPRPVTAPTTTHETQTVSMQLQVTEPIPVAIPPLSSSSSSSSVPVGQQPIAAHYPPAATNAPYQSSNVGSSSSNSSSSSSSSSSSTSSVGQHTGSMPPPQHPPQKGLSGAPSHTAPRPILPSTQQQQQQLQQHRAQQVLRSSSSPSSSSQRQQPQQQQQQQQQQQLSMTQQPRPHQPPPRQLRQQPPPSSQSQPYQQQQQQQRQPHSYQPRPVTVAIGSVASQVVGVSYHKPLEQLKMQQGVNQSAGPPPVSSQSQSRPPQPQHQQQQHQQQRQPQLKMTQPPRQSQQPPALQYQQPRLQQQHQQQRMLPPSSSLPPRPPTQGYGPQPQRQPPQPPPKAQYPYTRPPGPSTAPYQQPPRMVVSTGQSNLPTAAGGMPVSMSQGPQPSSSSTSTTSGLPSFVFAISSSHGNTNSVGAGGGAGGGDAGTRPSATQYYQDGNDGKGNGGNSNGVIANTVNGHVTTTSHPGNNSHSGGHSASLHATTSTSSSSSSSSSSSIHVSRASAPVSFRPSTSSSASSADVLDDNALLAMDLDIDSLLLKRREIAINITTNTTTTNNNNNVTMMTNSTTTATAAALATTSAAASTTINMGVSSSSSYSQHLLHPSPPESDIHASGPGLGPGLAPGLGPMQVSTNDMIIDNGSINHPILANKENFSHNFSEANHAQGCQDRNDAVVMGLVGDGTTNGTHGMSIDGSSLSNRGGAIATAMIPTDQRPADGREESNREEPKLTGSKRPLAGVENDWYISGSSASKDSSDVEGVGVGGSMMGVTEGLFSQEGNKRQATASSREMGINGIKGHAMNGSHSSSGDGCSNVVVGIQTILPSTHETQHLHAHQSCSSSSSSTLLPPRLSSPLPPTVTCIRLIVLDIMDDPQRRIKDLTCFMPDKATTAQLSQQQSHQQPQQPQQQQPQHQNSMNSARVVSSNMVVRVTGDWYHASIHGGDILHVLDLNMQSFLAAEPHPHHPWKSIFDVKRNPMGSHQAGGGHAFREGINNPHASTTSSIDALVDNEQGLVIIHPDVLISPTKVAEAIGCNRRGVLSDRIRSFGGTNEAAVMGNVKHAFIEAAVEKCLDRQASQLQQQQQQSTTQTRPYPPALSSHPSFNSSPLITEQEVAELISGCIASNLLDLMAVGLTDAVVETELRAVINPLIAWVRQITQPTSLSLQMTSLVPVGPSNHQQQQQQYQLPHQQHHQQQQHRHHQSGANSHVSDGSGGIDGRADAEYILERIVGTEETLWCPTLGIKGQIDLVAVATSRRDQCSGQHQDQGQGPTPRILPLEIKTGIWRPAMSINHRAQVMLYVLMMGIRERIVGQGIAPGQRVSSAQGQGLVQGASTRTRPPTQGMLLYLGSRAVPNDKHSFQSRNNNNGNHQYGGGSNGGNNQITSYQYKGHNNHNNNNNNNNGTKQSDDETTKCELVAPQWSDICSLIISRNELAVHIVRTEGSTALTNIDGNHHSHIPSMLHAPSECERCYQASECMTYHATHEHGTAISSHTPVLFDYVLRQVSSTHLSYLRHWEQLIDLEALATTSSSHLMWAISGEDRQMLSIQGSSKHQGGKCVSGLRLVSVAAATEGEIMNDGKAAGSSGAGSGNTSTFAGSGSGGGNGGVSHSNSSSSSSRMIPSTSTSLPPIASSSTSSSSTNHKPTRYLITLRRDPSTTGIASIAHSPTPTSLLMKGDRVYVSIEYHPHPPLSSDIEDLMLSNHLNASRRSPTSYSSSSSSASIRMASVPSRLHSHPSTGHPLISPVMTVEPNVTVGHVVNIDDEEVVVSVLQRPRRLERHMDEENPHHQQYQNHHIHRHNHINNHPQWSIRLDRDDANSGIGTMRTNLLTLFVDPYDPKKLEAHKRAAIFHTHTNTHTHTHSNMQSNAQMNVEATESSSSSSPPRLNASGNLHLRELIIDLRPPVFTSLPSATVSTHSTTMTASATTTTATMASTTSTATTVISGNTSGTTRAIHDGGDDDIFAMFSPAGMARVTFEQAIRALGEYKATYLHPQAHQPHLQQQAPPAQQQQPYQQPPQPHPQPHLPSYQPPPPPHITAIKRGPHGELHLFGGLTVYPGCDPLILYQEYLQLNRGQQDAVKRVLRAKDYALILGLPGTGKTSTLTLIVRALIARGQRVLISSYTHAAVDHLLLKLVEAGMTVPFVARLGAEGSVDQSLQGYVLTPESYGTVSNLQSRINPIRLVACTALAAAKQSYMSLFGQFDWCIVDEAGQIAQPIALGPLLRANAFLLVGDDYQLPPLVVSTEALSRGMNESLFKRLIRAHPQAAVPLTAQYRMNADIMTICNVLIYEHRMSCANDILAHARLSLSSSLLEQFAKERWTMLNATPSPAQVGDPKVFIKELLNARSGHRLRLVGGNNNMCGNSNGHHAGSSIGGAISSSRGYQDWLLRCVDPAHSVVFINTDALASLFTTGTPTTTATTSATTTATTTTTALTSAAMGPGLGPPNGSINVSTATNHNGVNKSNDTSNTTTNNNNTSNSLHNAVEVAVIDMIVQGLTACGMDVGQGLGIISPFRAQVRAISETLSVNPTLVNQSTPPLVGINTSTATTATAAGGISSSASSSSSSSCCCDVSTVDRFQGRDMDAIIFSTTKSLWRSDHQDGIGQAGDLLRDWRRINVAVTRARRKLIVIGSQRVMSQVPVLKSFVELMHQKNWVADL